MKRAERQNSLFRKWLIIEVCFLAFMIAVSLGMYLYTNSHIMRQLNALHMDNLLRIQTETDAMLESAKAAVSKYAISPDVRALMRSDYDENEREIAALVDNIKQTNATVPGISEIVVCFPDADLLISSAGVMDSGIFAAVYSDDIKNNMLNSQNSHQQIMPVQYARNGADIQTGMYFETVGANALIAAVLDRNQINGILESNGQNEHSFCLVYSKDDDLLFGEDILNDDPDASNRIMLSDVPVRLNGAQRSFYGISSISQNTGLKFISLIDAGRYYAQYFNIQKTALIILVLTTVLGFAISYYITRYKYQPVQKVISVSRSMTPKDVFKSSEDELQQIKRAIEFIYSEGEQTKKVLYDHSTHIKDNAVKMILDGEFNYSSATDYIKKLVDLRPEATYTVAVAEPNTAGTQLIDVLESMADNNTLMHALAKGGRLVLIFCGPHTDALEMLGGVSLVKNGDVTAAVGLSGSGFDGIRNSYQSALYGLSSKIIPGTANPIPPGRSAGDKAITISAEDEIRLCGAIQSGDQENALSLFSQLVNLHDIISVDVFSYKSYLHNISHTIVRAAEDIADDDFIRGMLADFNAAFRYERYQSITETLEQTIISIAAQYQKKMKSANDMLNTRLVRHIDTSISDPRLSAETIADAFHINAVYLRRFFKEHNGISFWDFINMKRIEMARDLLIATNSSIKSISKTCGYVSMSTFIRAFKKFSGMTPGHYRNLYH